MPSAVRFILAVTRPFWLYVLGLLLVAIGWSVIINVQPYLIKLIIDKVSFSRGGHLFQELLRPVAIYIGMSFTFVSLFRFHDYIVMHFIPKQREYIVLKVMKRMMNHSSSFYQMHFPGNLGNKINDLTLYTSDLIKILTDHFVTCFFTLIFVLCNVALVHPCFAWALGIWLTVFLAGSQWLLFRKNYLVYESAEFRAHIVGQIVDIFSNMTSIRLFNRRGYERNLLKKVVGVGVQKEQKRDSFFMTLHLFQGISFSVFECFCFWWLLQGVSRGTISPGSFVLVFTLNLQILDQFWHLGEKIREFWEKSGNMRQALKLVYSFPELSSKPNALPLVVRQGEIVFEKVHFFYQGSSPLFDESTVTIPGKQKVGLVGYSGGGKSTFVSLVLRLYDISSGAILIDGQDIRDVTLKSLRESIAVIPQDTTLFNRSIFENIRYGRLDATEEEVIEAARKAQVHDMILNLPKGYETLAGERGGRLSGGQRQRVGIARAILKDAPILILDEATSQQDLLTEDKLQEVLYPLMENKTVLVIAHRLKTLVHMDRILVFDGGHIVQDGGHQELLSQKGLYQRLWMSQTKNSL